MQHRAVYILHGVLAEFRCESEYLKQAWGKEVTACAGVARYHYPVGVRDTVHQCAIDRR